MHNTELRLQCIRIPISNTRCAAIFVVSFSGRGARGCIDSGLRAGRGETCPGSQAEHRSHPGRIPATSSASRHLQRAPPVEKCKYLSWLMGNWVRSAGGNSLYTLSKYIGAKNARIDHGDSVSDRAFPGRACINGHGRFESIDHS